jgi:dephospho-CoA kinase
MLKVAITGSVASGKSFILKQISKLNYPIISADAEIAKMYKEPQTLSYISSLFGIKDVSKEKIREAIFLNASKRRLLEAFLHKKLRNKFTNFARKCRLQGLKVCFFEIPLLFENRTHKNYDKILIIDSPIFVRRRRFIARGGLEKDFYKFNRLQLQTNQKLNLGREKKKLLILNFKYNNHLPKLKL